MSPGVRTASPGASDKEILALAIREERILLTFDKDFGEIARAATLPAKCGVILLRVPMPPPREIARLAVTLMGRDDWGGRFSVVEPGRIRSRALVIL